MLLNKEKKKIYLIIMHKRLKTQDMAPNIVIGFLNVDARKKREPTAELSEPCWGFVMEVVVVGE